jgi:type VI secretion system secreted protein VgrG
MPTDVERYSQKDRLIAAKTPLADDFFLLQGFSGTEAISSLFQFQLDLMADSKKTVEFDKLLGQKVTVTLLMPENKKRYFSGIVNRFSQGMEVRGGTKETTAFILYRAQIVPQFWLLTRKVQSRIFQQKSVPDILKEVLKGLDVTWDIKGTFEPRDYCVQYRESDFNFASRLMEEEGIYYFFKHDASSHKMVVANSPASHADVPGATKVSFGEVAGEQFDTDRIYGWEKTQEIRSGKYTLWDHSFELPDKNLEAKKTILESLSVGSVDHKLKVGGNDQFEIYDYPGAYAQRFDGIAPGGGSRSGDVQKIFDDNVRTVGIRMQEETLPSLVIAGESNCRQFASGHKFTLEKHFNANGPYVLTKLEHSATMGSTYVHSGEDEAPSYRNVFDCIPSALPYRPLRVTPKARVDGTQTAVVVGPSGEEIFTDKYSRVKVQFHWDREGKKDASSSCWVRVATPYAGKNRGWIRIPRIGEEVIVDFLEGDPDQPIIVGCVFNFNNMPPYVLPDNKTQSGLKTRSTLKGEIEHFNELRFEDKKDSEEVYLHAQKDLVCIVENNAIVQVGYELKDGTHKSDDGSQTVKIYKDRTETLETGNESVTVQKGNRTVTLDTGNDTHQLKKGHREVLVDMGNDKHQIKKGNREVLIDMGNDALTIKMGNQTTKLNLGKSSTEAMQSIELKVGQSSIKVDQIGVTIKGMMIKIEGTAMLQAKAPMSTVKGDGILIVKGGITMIN